MAIAVKYFNRSTTADAAGLFQIGRVREPTLVLAYSVDQKFGGTQIVEADQDSATVTLNPMATVKFRLVDAA